MMAAATTISLRPMTPKTTPSTAGRLPPEASDPDAGEILDVDGEVYVRWLEGGCEGPDPLEGAKLLRETNPELAARLA
jgi:hypothetical protein